MTGENHLPIRHLSRTDLEQIHAVLYRVFENQGEPIPPFSLVDENNLDAFIKLSQSTYFGVEQYPTLASKAAIIFYTLNKKHLFLNGNKRMSVLCLLVFLELNGQRLSISPDDLTAKALWLAQTTHTHEFPEIKEELERWLADHLTNPS